MISRDDDSFIEVLVYIGTPAQGIELKLNTMIPYSYIQYRLNESTSNIQIPSNDTIMVNSKYEVEPKIRDILLIDNYTYIITIIIFFSNSININLLIDRIATDLDLSDYDKIIRYCKVADNFADANNPTYFTTGCKVRPWWRCFNDMKVEDDRK